MASSQKASEGVKIPGGVSVIEQRRQSFAKELATFQDEASIISEELEQPLFSQTQKENRAARLGILRKWIATTQSAIVYLGEIQTRVERACQAFDLVTLPKGSFVGLVEPLPEKQVSKKPILKRLRLRRICYSAIIVMAAAVLVSIFVGDDIGSKLFIASFAGGIVAMLIILGLELEGFIEPLEDPSPSPHSVFRGVIPKLALQRYDALKTAGLFDSIIVASPHKDAFVQMGRRYDPVMVGVVGSRIRFDWNGFATVESAGLTDSCVFLFEIARWDTAADLGNLV